MHVLCFGEPLIRFATEAHERLEEAQELEISYGGAESTVAISLAQQGEIVRYATKLTNNRLGTNSLMTLARYGIDTSRVIRSEGRMGIYFTERGKSIRPTIVTYDRSGTAMAKATHNDFDWDHMLNGIEVFFFSGVVPAISRELSLACEDALTQCKGRGILTIADLNYRHTMWSRLDALQEWERLLPMVDVLTCSEDDIILISDASVEKNNLLDYCIDWSRNVLRRHSLRAVASIVRMTDRFEVGNFKGALVQKDGVYLSKNQQVVISDVSSCGSVFSAAFAHALFSQWDPQFVIEYATMASAYKATIRGDLSFASETEIAALLADTVSPSILQ